jgi:hypothetical protein
MADQLVTLTINRVRQIDNPDGWGGGDADYYAKVRFNGTWNKSGHKNNVKDWQPNWKFRGAAADDQSLPIRIELWDHDSTSADDLCDINPRKGKKGLDLVYNLKTGQITGDLSGTRGSVIHAKGSGDSDRAEIWFTIDHAKPAVPSRLPEVWASDLRVKLEWEANPVGSDLSAIESTLVGFNNRLYDCTDGQWRVGRFLIHDRRSELGSKDKGVGHVHRTDTHGPHGHADGRPNSPKHWHANEMSNVGTFLMEFLHSWTGLKDEYEQSQNGPKANCPATKALRDATKACVMDTSYGTPRKLCRPHTHNPETEQGSVRKMDCYSWLRKVMHSAGKTGFQVPMGHIEGPINAPLLRLVYLTIQRVEQIDNPDGFGGGDADYYSKVRMDGLWFSKSKRQDNRKVVSPNWFFGFAFSSAGNRTIPIRLELWDHDSTSADDLCDINPRKGKKGLDLLYNTATGAVTGDVTGSRDTPITVQGSGDSDRARIRFTLTSR